MFKRSLAPAVALGTALLAIGGLTVAADDSTVHMHAHAEIPAAALDHMVEMAKTSADHEKIAMSFEDEATALEKQAAHHEKLTQRYRSGVGAGPKGDTESLANHCDLLVKNLRESAQEAHEMARMHREVAKHLAK